MTQETLPSIAAVLRELAASRDATVAATASVFKTDTQNAASDTEASNREIKERLFAVIARQLEADKDPTTVVESLVYIDDVLASRAGLIGPYAGRFAPVAAALIAHLSELRQTERQERKNAENAPIVEWEKKHLSAAIHAPIGRAGAVVFAERMLRAVLKHRPSIVHFIVRLEEDAAQEIADIWSAMINDLKEQGIRVAMDDDSPKVLRSPSKHSAR